MKWFAYAALGLVAFIAVSIALTWEDAFAANFAHQEDQAQFIELLDRNGIDYLIETDGNGKIWVIPDQEKRELSAILYGEIFESYRRP